MRVLLDESLPRQLAAALRGHEVATVPSMGWSSMGNGELLSRAVTEAFSVFVTADQGIEFQQNLRDMGLGVVVIQAPSNRMEHLEPLVNEILAAISSVEAGALVRVS